MNCRSTRNFVDLAMVLVACGVLAAGVGGLLMLRSLQAHSQRAPMLLAPMIGVIEPCVMVQEDAGAPEFDDLRATCTGPNGSAAKLVESTLTGLQHAAGAAPAYPLGYTLPVPLLQLFRKSADGWEIDTETVGRLVRTVRDNSRPLILYLFSTHFSTGAPLEKALAADSANLAQTRDGPLAQSRYYGAPLNNWTFATTETELTARRVQATRALLEAVCRLPAVDVAKIRGVTLLGELHHLFPDFEAGMGFAPPYRVTDYSPHSVAGFRQFLKQEFGRIEQLNRVLGSDYASFEEVQPPSRDIRTERLRRFTEHIDSFAHGSLPIAGWAYAGNADGTTPPWVHIYRNGVFVGKTLVNQGRQDVLAAHPEFGDANTGWRWDLDFRHLPTGLHRIDVFIEQKPGQLTLLGTRNIALMDREQSSPKTRPQMTLPSNASPLPTIQGYIDLPTDQSAYYYNPLVPLWHTYRGRQVVNYLKFFNSVLNHSCLAQTPHYTHQITPFTNPGWDANKYAIQASLENIDDIRLGVSLYGNAAYSVDFSKLYQHTMHRGYGITEFHPLKAMDTAAIQKLLTKHAADGAEFLSFFLEPRWRGTVVASKRNIFSLDSDNKNFGSDILYQSLQKTLAEKNAFQN